MTLGSSDGRLLLSAGLVTVLLVWDVLLPWIHRKRPPHQAGHKTGSASESPFVAAAAKTFGDAAASASIQRSSASPDIAALKAKRKWTAARTLKHGFIPDWKRDMSYLRLVLEAAKEGSEEAMNKLGEYAFRRKNYIEAYYWKLKVEMSGGRCRGTQLTDILFAWIKRDCPGQYKNVTKGFTEEQGMFARSIMRLKAGVDEEKAEHRLQALEEAGNADVLQYQSWIKSLTVDMVKASVQKPGRERTRRRT